MVVGWAGQVRSGHVWYHVSRSLRSVSEGGKVRVNGVGRGFVFLSLS